MGAPKADTPVANGSCAGGSPLKVLRRMLFPRLIADFRTFNSRIFPEGGKSSQQVTVGIQPCCDFASCSIPHTGSRFQALKLRNCRNYQFSMAVKIGRYARYYFLGTHRRKTTFQTANLPFKKSMGARNSLEFFGTCSETNYQWRLAEHPGSKNEGM